MDATFFFTAGVRYLILLFAISVHEAAHAWTADRLGDPTARGFGRTSLNPLRHLDLFGSILLPLLLLAFGTPAFFGWGRPAPVVAQNLRDPRRHDILVALAGPAANFLLAALATVAFAVAVDRAGVSGQQAAVLSLAHQESRAAGLAGFPVVYTLLHLAIVNAFLGVFNLIPVPPLDGGRIAYHLLPPDWAERLAAVRPYGFMIGMAVAMFNLVTLALLPFFFVLSLLINFA
jgi:Zn-dependent protease